MRKLIILSLIIVVATIAFELHPVDVDRNFQLTPPPGATIDSPDSNYLEAKLPRNVLTFDFPAGYFDEDNLIMEAVLKVAVEPTAVIGYEAEAHRPIEAVCVPLTSAPGGSPTWASLNAAYNMDYAEFGVYDAEEGILFFEIARLLYAANDGEIAFYGVMIIPTKGSPSFRILDTGSPIDFRTANFYGARATE